MEWHLVIVGNDDDGSGQELTLELNQLGLSERVTQLKSQPATELGPIYNAADLLLLPSRHENFGNVVVEAMACGCGSTDQRSNRALEEIFSMELPSWIRGCSSA